MTTFTKTTVGADACPAGWFATVIDSDGIKTDTYDEFKKLRKTYDNANRILVDIPIGLPEDERRQCDEDAREWLGSRGLSVFYPPCQTVLKFDDYDEANDRHREQIGHGLSQQAFSIRGKIQEVSAVVGDQYGGLVLESHPELCFAALNGQPIAYSKSSDRGRGLRMELLEDELANARALYDDARNKYLIKEVRRDDILDSMVLAVAAQEKSLITVPSDPSATEPRMYYPAFEVPILAK